MKYIQPLIDKFYTLKKISKVKSVYSDFFRSSDFSKPFITIAREPGSGGHPVGKIVAQRLGFQFIDEELIDVVAKSTKKRKEILQQIDEKGRSAIDDLVHGLVNPDYVSDVTFVTELTKTILTYAYKGNVVILGRGSNIITPFAKGLHIRITAPYSVRVQRAIDFEGHSPEKAREIVQAHEKDRKDFVKQYLRKNIDDADLYDLTINTKSLTASQSVELILNAFHAKFSKLQKVKSLLK